MSQAACQVLFVQRSHGGDLPSQPWDGGFRHRRASASAALTIQYGDDAVFEIDILHPQAHGFHQAQARTVQQGGDQAQVRFIDAAEDGCDLALAQDGRNLPWLAAGGICIDGQGGGAVDLREE